jgi:circadian clock protein KaiC
MVLTGSARFSQEARENAEEMLRLHEAKEKGKALEAKRKALEARIAALRAEFAEEEDRVAQSTKREDEREMAVAGDITKMASLRGSKLPRKDQGA